MSNAFTPPGTSARQAQLDQQHKAAGYLSGLLPGAASYDQAQQTFASSQLPYQEQGVQNAYYNTTQGGRNAMVNSFGAGQNANAEGAGAAAYSKFAGNPSLAAGYQVDQGNQANDRTAQYANQVNSPQGQAGAWGNYMNAANSTKPNYSNVAQLAGGVYAQPPAPVGPGLGQILGQIAGSYVSSQTRPGGGGGVSGATAIAMDPNEYTSSDYPMGPTGEPIWSGDYFGGMNNA